MNQEIHNYDKEVVKVITNSIFKEEITSTQVLKDRVYQNGHDDKDVSDILNVLLYSGIIDMPRYELNGKFREHDFMVNMHKLNEVEREGLI
ncbi:hypothetical protein [Mammaliicoccus vitulinus]|uniref:hypothetical protein n=1 Tax=Mammaliicoccus vitulinus TaxID=71237 RepID=UPI0028D7BA83|nr:hypothetical protein [Mammaliicoccus vitulinus]